MEAKPTGWRNPPPPPRCSPGGPLIPPNYVTLKHLQELRLKEQQQEALREIDEVAKPNPKPQAALPVASHAEKEKRAAKPRGPKQWVVAANQTAMAHGGTAKKKKETEGLRKTELDEVTKPKPKPGGPPQCVVVGSRQPGEGTGGKRTGPRGGPSKEQGEAAKSRQGAMSEDKGKGKASGDEKSTEMGTNSEAVDGKTVTQTGLAGPVKVEGTAEKSGQPVVEAQTAAGREPRIRQERRDASSSGPRPGGSRGGNGGPRLHGQVWVPKVTAPAGGRGRS